MVDAVTDTIVALGASAMSLLTENTLIDSTLGIQAVTLADGTEGQTKLIKMAVDGGDSVVTPANLFDGATLTFDDVNDSALLRFIGGAWNVIGTPTATLA